MLKNYTRQLGITEGCIRKILMTMRLTTILLITMMMQVSANGLAQSMSFSKSNTTYKEVFDQIRKQLGYNVVWPSKKFDANKNVDVNIRNASLERVLEQVLDKQEVSYVVKKKTVVLTVKVKSFVDKVVEYFSTIDVRGKVVDEQGLPLPGASVKVKAGTLATVTDKDGDFFLKGVPEDAVIVIAYLGYKPLELKAATSVGVIKLELAIADLNEVVINKGYYTTTRALNTGSVSKVTAEEIGKQPVTNPLAALQGRMTGVSIQQTSGVPGGDFKIQIRGQNSLRNDGNEPLYIIDGVPFSTEKTFSYFATGTGGSNSFGNPGFDGQVSRVSPLTSINTADIESIEILKDADATAIYGSRGANGVVFITTKKGKQGQTKVDVNAFTGFGRVPHLDFLNTQEYLNLRREAFASEGLIPSANIGDDGSPAKGNRLYAPDLMVWDTTRYTDWQRELMNNAQSTSIQASISGGNQRTQFLFGTGYRQEKSVYKSDLGYQKGSIHFNANHKSKDQKLTASFSLSGTKDGNRQPTQGLVLSRNLPPNAPALYEKDGSLNWANSTWLNPLANAEIRYRNEVNSFTYNTTLSYTIVPGLSLKSNFGINYLNSSEMTKKPSTYFDPALGDQSAQLFVSESSGVNKSWIVEPQVNWEKITGKSKLTALIGGTFQDQQLQRRADFYYGFSNDTYLDNISLATFKFTNESIKSLYRYAAVFGRLNYNWKEKYILNITGRRDGSSRFGPGRQFANFGAIGAAWIFSNEEFIRNYAPFLSFGKLRGSYGITGNDQIGNYQYLDTYAEGSAAGGNQYQGVTYLSPTRLFNPDYAWEVNRKFEVALEMGLFNDRISTVFNYFRNRSTNQLIDYTLPQTTGFSGILANLPAAVQNTGVEIEVSSFNISAGPLRWTTSFNMTFPKNKLIAFPNLESSSYANRYVLGEPLSVFKMYDLIGVDPVSGFWTFIDVNNDGQISDPEDRTKSIFAGQDFFGGLNNSFTFKGWSLDFLFQFVKQAGFGNALSYGLPGKSMVNIPEFLLNENIWRQPGDDAEIQKLSVINENAEELYSNYRMSSGSIVDASFIRLKNVAFSYQLPKIWTRNLGCRVYFQGQNLMLISGYEGDDPEIQGYSTLPALKMFTFGLQLTL